MVETKFAVVLETHKKWKNSQVCTQNHTHTHTHTECISEGTHSRVLQEVIDEFRKGLLGRGSPVWVRLHLHIHPWAPSACTHRSHWLRSTPSLSLFLSFTHTHTHAHTHTNMVLYSFRHVILLLSGCLLYNAFHSPSHSSSVGETGGGGLRVKVSRASRTCWHFLVPEPGYHDGPAWGCFWQQPLRQIIEEQMKTNDMIAERVSAVNPLSRWFPFKAIDQLYNLSSWPGN